MTATSGCVASPPGKKLCDSVVIYSSCMHDWHGIIACIIADSSCTIAQDIAAGLAAESSALVDSTQDCVDASIESLNQHTRACLAAGREAAAQAALEQAVSF